MTADPHGYSSHTHVLHALAAEVRVRRVVEFGGGLYSTRLFLDRDVFPDLVELTTVETDQEWAREIGTGDSRHGVIFAARASAAVPWFLLPGHDLVLVDDSDTETARIDTLRAVSAARPRGLVVIHDFENENYREATKFDHVAESQRLTPWTAVAWNEGARHGGERLHRVVAAS